VKKLVFLIISLFIVLIPALNYTQTMSDYCSAPPYVTRTVPPNIMIVYEKISDILNRAYSPSYEASRNYYGFFDTSAKYEFQSSKNYFIKNNACAGDNCFSGNLLNWAVMSSLDISRKALVGFGWPETGIGAGAGNIFTYTGPLTSIGQGKSVTVSGGGYTFCLSDATGSNPTGVKIRSGEGYISCDAGTIVVNGEVRMRFTDETRVGVIQRFADKDKNYQYDTDAPRFGIRRWYNGNDKQEDIIRDSPAVSVSEAESYFRNLLTAISKAPPDDPQTPELSDMVAEIAKYFQGTFSSYDDKNDFSQTPYNWNSDPLRKCRRNAAILITTGTYLGTDTISPLPPVCSTSDKNSSALSVNTCYAYNKDLYEADGTPPNQAMKTYIVHTTFYGSGTGNEDKLRYAARAGKGSYVKIEKPQDLEDILGGIVVDILQSAASGTAVSVLTTSSRGAGSVVQAYFLPLRVETGPREVGWTGYLQNLWTDSNDNLREDSVQDRKLILNQDKVVKLYVDPSSNETEAALFTTMSDGSGGTFAACSGHEIKPLTEVKAVWEAGEKLALKNPSERRIFTSRKLIRGSSVTTFSETPYPEFKKDMNVALKNALNPDATYSADNIIAYVRGECLETGVTGDTGCGTTVDPRYRDRRLTAGGSLHAWKLGDIISSVPKVFSGVPLNTYHIDYADKSYYDYISGDHYKKKSAVVFVGANDGMLHAFRAGYLKDKGLSGDIKAVLKNFFASSDNDDDGLGEEIWAYIPLNAFPYLKYLADPNYCHLYYSDLSVKPVDVSITGGPESVRNKESWKTILLGGMRFGGACGPGGTPSAPPGGISANIGYSSYFALDVTDPENPVPLWEYSDQDMGYSTSFPSIIRTGDRTRNGEWYAVIGSGSNVLPKGGVDVGRNTTGYIYILNLRTGELVKKIALDHNAIVSDILTVDADKDYQSEKIYFGTSYKPGTLWMGKLVSINIPAVLGTGGINVPWSSSFGKILFSGNYPFTASPDAVKDSSGNIWVYSGSGKYYSDLDEADASQQIFFGLKDGGATVAEAALYDSTTVQTKGDVTETAQICAYNPSSKKFGLRTVVTAMRLTSPAPSVPDAGWKMYLTGGERVISRPLAAGGLVDFLTYKPDPDPCSYGGDSHLYSVSYTAGVAPSSVAIRLPEATSASSGNVTVYKGVHLGPGAPPTGEAIIIAPPKEGVEQLRKKIQVATGVIVEAEDQPLFPVISKIVHWLKK
jgi:hypothetical protein